jgi:cell division protein FtsB
MAITYDDVARAAHSILQDNKNPTILGIRSKLGDKGSETTIGKFLSRWKEGLPKSSAVSHIEIPSAVYTQLTLWLRAHEAITVAALERKLEDAAQDEETLSRAARALEDQVKELELQLSAMTTERDQTAGVAREKKLENEQLFKELERERQVSSKAHSELATAHFQVTSQAERLNEFRAQLESSARSQTELREAKSAAEVRAAVANSESQAQLKISEERSMAVTALEHRYRQCQESIFELQTNYEAQIKVEQGHCMRLEDEVLKLRDENRRLSEAALTSADKERDQRTTQL